MHWGIWDLVTTPANLAAITRRQRGVANLISLRPKGDHVFIYLEGAHQSLVYTHHPPGVVELSAVVGSGEQRDQLSLGEKLITILHDLWQTSSQKILIFRIKVSDDMLWKVKGFTSD